MQAKTSSFFQSPHGAAKCRRHRLVRMPDSSLFLRNFCVAFCHVRERSALPWFCRACRNPIFGALHGKLGSLMHPSRRQPSKSMRPHATEPDIITATSTYIPKLCYRYKWYLWDQRSFTVDELSFGRVRDIREYLEQVCADELDRSLRARPAGN